jgi:hypothetical protein
VVKKIQWSASAKYKPRITHEFDLEDYWRKLPKIRTEEKVNFAAILKQVGLECMV